MKRNVNETLKDQVQYLGRWFDKKHFRTFVYDESGKQTLAENYKQYQDLISSGIWFDVKPDASPPKRKQKDGSPNS
jgi:hypothetical protein